MNQNFFEQLSFTKQFYRAFGNYYGVPTTTTSQASEYLSSARTQPSILKKQKSSPKPLISLKKPLTSNSIRVKTQTQHIPKQQTISHHVKSLSSDIKTHTPQKLARTERTVFQTESNQHPFLIIQKKAKELRRLESRKSTQEQVKSESQHSVQSSLKIRTVESPVNVPLIPLLPQIPIIQISEPHEQETPKISEQAQEQESEEQAKEPQESQEQNSFSSSKMKRVSVKLKFKNAVQSQVSTLFINKQPKSLFNIIISPEFSLKHELERQKISECFEAGNFILCKALAMTTKTQNTKEQYIKQRYPIKHSHKMNNIVTTQVIKLNTTNKAFQRKIKMIITTTDNNKEEQPQQFSLLSKLKKSQFQKWQSNDLLEPGIENYKDQITITITNDLKEDTIHTFMRPKFSKLMDSVIEDVQVASPTKSNITTTKKAFQHSGSLHQSTRQIMLRHSITQNAIKDEYSNCTATTPNIEEASNLDFNLEFSKVSISQNKANLYVRLYYQKVLHKLPRKTNFSGLNLQEIEDDFVAQQLLIKTSHINFQTTDVQGVEQLCPTLAFEQKVDIQKYFVPQIKWEPAVNFDRQSTYSSSSSDEIVSLDQILEEPNQRLSNPHEHETKLQNIIKSMKDIKDDSQDQIFIEDMQKNHSSLSTGQLVPIKKARNHFHWPLDLKCIISVLDQQTKNILLTFRQKEISIEEILSRMNQDTDGQAFKLLDKYYRYSQLRHRIIDEMTMRYDNLLVGRYRDEQSVIDIEHKETTLENILENTKLSEMKPLAKKPDSQILEIVKLKKQVHQSNKINKNSQKLTSKQTNTSPENNISKQQYSNQLTSQLTNNNNNNNIITQSTTQYLTKPTNQSQQSMNGQKVYKKSKSNNADLSDSSSAKSIKSKSELNSSQLISNQIQKSQQYLEVQQDKKDRHKHTKSQTVSVQNNDSKLQSMQQSSLRMRSHAYQCEQRQKYDQKYQVKFSIEDNNYQEFLENLVHLPEMYLDNRFENNDTFLTMAAQNGNVDIVKELIKRGADINIQNDDGNTPLHLALAYNHYSVADILMQSGASSHIFNKSGKNAWSVL